MREMAAAFGLFVATFFLVLGAVGFLEQVHVVLGAVR